MPNNHPPPSLGSASKEILKRAVGAVPGLSIYLRRKKEDYAQRRAPTETPYGFMLGGNAQMESGIFEPSETAIFKALLPHFNRFLNIGANIGYYCCHALQAGLPTIAFEPSPRNVEMLLRNIVANGWEKQVEVFPLALSDAPGILQFYGEGTGASLIPGWSGTPVGYVSRVPASTLDTALGNRILSGRSLILMDVEGAELSVLQGASAHLKEGADCVWMLEICISEHMPAGTPINPALYETFDLFWSHGFEAHTADGSGRVIDRTAIRRVVESGIDDIGTHNFIFAKGPQARAIAAALRTR